MKYTLQWIKTCTQYTIDINFLYCTNLLRKNSCEDLYMYLFSNSFWLSYCWQSLPIVIHRLCAQAHRHIHFHGKCCVSNILLIKYKSGNNQDCSFKTSINRGFLDFYDLVIIIIDFLYNINRVTRLWSVLT